MIHRLTVVLAMLLASTVGGDALAADQVSDGQWFHSFLKTSQANSISAGSGVKVAIIDSGVDASHPDLAGSVLPGTDLTAPSGGDGRIDSDGHGTGMAGLIVAHGRVNGIALEARVLPVRTGVAAGGGVSRLAQGVRWAVANGAQVISISNAVDEDDLLLRQEIQAALQADVVIVAAAGNLPDDQGVQYPAAIPGVLAVAGVDRNGNRSSVSVTGPEVDIAAPSDNISSTDKGGGYRIGTGTSDATAIVAGAAALVRSRFPDLKASEVVRRLTATATDKGPPGRDNEYGYGVLNLVAALTADLPTATTAAPSKAPTPAPTPESPTFPWWLAAAPILAAAIAIFLFLQRRRRNAS